VESTAKVEAAVKLRDVEVPLHVEGGIRLQQDLAGKKVTFDFSQRQARLGYWHAHQAGHGEQSEGTMGERMPMTPGESFLILKTAKGRMYINPQDVMMIQMTDDSRQVREEELGAER